MPVFDGSLRGLLGPSLAPEQALHYFSQLLDGVEAAHLLGVVHRDLKPENILFDKANDRVLVADFGIAHFREEEIYTSVETNPAAKLANLQYAAPEQRTRGVTVGIPADIYAIGLILNELVTGHVPAGTEYVLIGTVVPGHSYLDDLVGSMLRQDPAKRPQSIDEIKTAINSRHKEFLERQKLLQISREVVPRSTLSDPILNDPPRLVDFDWANRTLTLVLSRTVSQDWVNAFRNIGSRQSVHGADVNDFTFQNHRAFVAADYNRVQEIIDTFKTWLPRATEVYRSHLQHRHEVENQQERKRLQEEREEQERRLALRKNVKL
jgi:serine/threonine protein kinase